MEILSKYGFIFKELKEIEPKELNTRKRIKILTAIDLRDRYVAIFEISQKSRFLQKDSIAIESIYQKLSRYKEIDFRVKVILIDAPICSKAKVKLKESSWRIIEDDSM